MADGNLFTMVPLSFIADSRVNFRPFKVFTSICSFRKSSDDFCVEASREEIASRCGFNASIVSTATTELQRLGWLKKQGAGGRVAGGGGLKTVYIITTPETVPDSGTVTEFTTVPKSVSRTVPDSGTPLYTKNVNRDISISVPDGFPEFWDAYAKKVGKAAAIAQWKKLKPNADLVCLMISAAKRYSAATEQQFRKDPERWIRDRRWEDETQSCGVVSAKPEVDQRRQRFGITERFDATMGWVPVESGGPA